MLGAGRAALLGFPTFARQAYGDVVGALDPLAYWRLGEASGTTIADAKGVQDGTYEGTAQGTIEYGLDPIVQNSVGTAVGFDGISTYGQVLHNPVFELASYTVDFAFQADTAPSVGQNRVLLSKDATDPPPAGALSIEIQNDAGQLKLRAYAGGGTGSPIWIGGPGGAADLQLAKAYKVALTLDALAGAKLYLDGVEIANAPAATVGWASNPAPLVLGAYSAGALAKFDGVMDEVVLFGTQLSGDQIASLAKVVSISRPSEYITTPEAHGWSTGNTVPQNTTAFNTAIANANANAAGSSTGRGVVELVQGKTYIVGSGNGGTNNQNAALSGLANVEIRTTGKPSRASGDQAVIQMDSWSGKTGVHNRCILKYQNASNFFLGWVTIDGNKNTLSSSADINYDFAQDGGIHNIVIITGAQNFTVKEVLSRLALVDGIIFYEKAGGAAPTDGLIEDCTFTRNRRQGMSIGQIGTVGGGADQVVFRRCTFSDTGDYPGDIEGQKPGAGVDLEPDGTGETADGLTFDDCDFEGNLGSTWHHGADTGTLSSGRGFVADSRANSNDIKLLGCRCTGNGENFAIVLRNTPIWNRITIENLVCSGGRFNDRLNLYGSAGDDGGRFTDMTIANANVPQIFIEAGFPPPWDAGHSITIWRGNFNPTLSNLQPISLVTNNAGFPP